MRLQHKATTGAQSTHTHGPGAAAQAAVPVVKQGCLPSSAVPGSRVRAGLWCCHRAAADSTHAAAAGAGQPGAEQELLAGLLPAAAGGAAGAAEQQPAERPGLDSISVKVSNEGQHSPQQQQPASHEAAAGVLSDSSSTSGSGALLKLQRQLAKALARRAAAHVELRQLQEASEDLQQALRCDPGNAQLQADALELSAAINTDAGTTAASLKERADARFKAGDHEGAAEVYTSLVRLAQQQPQQQADKEAAVEQEQQQQQECATQLLAALSNRAACWLSLEQYTKCIEDCQAALVLAFAEQDSKQDAVIIASAGTPADVSDATGGAPGAAAAAESSLDAATQAAVACDGVSHEQGAAAGQRVLQLLHQHHQSSCWHCCVWAPHELGRPPASSAVWLWRMAA
ncbi:hypothetical protein COO60DRAFT_517951 [Scenedesmus sp. NREL 46B-D3]|nr:hypothetical protein COO60DRAFT_517951 [Scenedesmus sp. NREL 46B-D3]